ncbi:MAG: hypothetical protein O2862_08410 [Bacteroidetes bacterium]|nr:hypothetical protein [Bacteroidota bacterium]MDA0898614.1 hypothetical protein [Bacteroidota bacterium]
MTIKAATVAEYIDQIPEDRKVVFEKLLTILRIHLPNGFEELARKITPEQWIATYEKQLKK